MKKRVPWEEQALAFAIVYGLLLVAIVIWARRKKPWDDKYLFESFWLTCVRAPITASVFSIILCFKYGVWALIPSLKD